MNREDIKVGSRVQVNKKSSRYRGSYGCSSDCGKHDCFLHKLSSDNGIVRITETYSTTVRFDKKHKCGGYFAFSQLEEIFELMPYNWKKL